MKSSVSCCGFVSHKAAVVDDIADCCRQLHVLGFGGDVLRPYKRPAASELHRTRAAAVRRAQATTTAGANAQAEGS